MNKSKAVLFLSRTLGSMIIVAILLMLTRINTKQKTQYPSIYVHCLLYYSTQVDGSKQHCLLSSIHNNDNHCYQNTHRTVIFWMYTIKCTLYDVIMTNRAVSCLKYLYLLTQQRSPISLFTVSRVPCCLYFIVENVKYLGFVVWNNIKCMNFGQIREHFREF